MRSRDHHTGRRNFPQTSLSLVRKRHALPDLASAQALVMDPSVWSCLVMHRDWLIVGDWEATFFFLSPLLLTLGAWGAQLMISDSSRSALRNSRPTAMAMVSPAGRQARPWACLV